MPDKKFNTLVTLQVSSEEPSSSIQVVDIGVLEEFYRAFEEVRDPA